MFGSGRGYNANRRTFQPRFDGREHAGTECLVIQDPFGGLIDYGGEDFLFLAKPPVTASRRNVAQSSLRSLTLMLCLFDGGALSGTPFPALLTTHLLCPKLTSPQRQ